MLASCIGRWVGPKSLLDFAVLRKSHNTHYHPVRTTQLKIRGRAVINFVS